MLGFFILSMASLLAGLAWSEAAMNAGRALQGLGSAFILPAALTIVMILFSHNPKERNKALGYWGASAAAGGTAGVFLGGVITEWLSWNWTFLINIPVGIFALFYSMRVLPAGERQKGSVDVIGSLAITAALILAVYAIVTAEQVGWGSVQTLTLLLIAALLLLVFFVIQKVKREPLIPLGIFAAPNLLAGNLAFGLLAGAWIPLWFFLNLYLQQVLQFSAFAGGVALVPMTVLVMVVMIGLTGRLVGRFGFKSILVIGFLALTGSLFLLAGYTPIHGSFVANVLPASLLGALGMALAFIPGTIASMSGAKPEETGLASGIANTSYQIGSAIGLAIMSAVAASWTGGQLEKGAEQIAALNTGFHAAFIGAAIASVAGALLALLFLRKPKQ
ncbi:MFS transporter [Paenibacillus sp. CC-CFT747]|nr:MFS transporter [Paenibacillus sp. CC-CFT747]